MDARRVRGCRSLRPRRTRRGRSARAAASTSKRGASRSRRWSRRTRSGRCTRRSPTRGSGPGRAMSVEAARRARSGSPSTCCAGSRWPRASCSTDDDYRESDVETFRAVRRRRRDVRRGGDAAVHPGGRVVDGPGRGRRALAVPRERRRPAACRRVAARLPLAEAAEDGGRRARGDPVADGRVLPAPHAGRDQPPAGRQQLRPRIPGCSARRWGSWTSSGSRRTREDVAPDELAGFVESFEAPRERRRGGRVVGGSSSTSATR